MIVDPGVTRLRPGTRRRFQILGPVVLGLGLVALVGLIYLSASAADARRDCLRETPTTSFQHNCNQEGPSSVLFVLVVPFVVVGGFLTRFGYMKPIAEITATETSGAAQVTGAAVGRGLKESLGGGAPVVRVRCRACGFLESEDAKYCSNCRAAM